MVVYGSLQAKFMGTKHDSHIHRYGTPEFGNIIFHIAKPYNYDKQILWDCKLCLHLVCDVFIYIAKGTFDLLFCIPYIINAVMEALEIGAIHNKLLDSNGGTSIHIYNRSCMFTK